ncbi:hybrid-cluster NAD(P)-dependent oxidoreductase [Vibrio sp. S4M6]|uniref:hybrid-cluster NAD(P)-dependent oxidoreductase n=1 Tax=Vibrio sinus TaxID=2946865 RepID=UPI00202A22F6|nr:hybrid-cluster NAD(P)-dependent oxidoreductase [Vibrio sinus]MCL9780606.1 hybrid-cluster NAD(P)-dependent oxidoreductase [Vibrio sinus]
MSSASLSQINIYPVKSTAGISLTTSWVEKQGLSFDRRFMLALSDGSMVTARKFPQMVLVHSCLLPDGIMFSAEGKAPLKLAYSQFKHQQTPAKVWKDEFIAYTTTDEANDWFSKIVGQRVELLFTGEQSNRVRAKFGHNVSFADGYPLLVISQASLDELNRRSSETHSMDQFRTNLVIDNTEPFEEDGWKKIRIGEVVFESLKPCERCILTTVDTVKGEFRQNKEPLKTLSQFRALPQGSVFFGQNLVALNEGMIRAGDKVEVLEYKDKEVYQDNAPQQQLLTCVEVEEIARNFVTFWLEPQHSHATPYRPGQHLPIEINMNGKVISRRYTLSSSPSRPGRLAISVKRVDGGEVSNWLIDNFKVGDTLDAEKPDGTFHLGEHHDQPLLLLSAGSGVTPMLSMLRYLSDHDQLHDVIFYHQCSSVEDIPYKTELDELERRYAGLKVMIALTQSAPSWYGLKGRLSLTHIKQIADLEKRQVFVCGPDGFMKKAKNLMLKKGLPEDSYHQEVFGITQATTAPVKKLQLSLNGFLFEGDNQTTLLEQAEKAGLSIANSCRAGLCGACKVTIESGKVNQPDVPALQEDERNMGMALACCCVPETDIEAID